MLLVMLGLTKVSQANEKPSLLARAGNWFQAQADAAMSYMPAPVQVMWNDRDAAMDPIKQVAVGFILIAVALVIALTILPVVTSAVETAATDGNISATDATLLRLLPTLLIVGLIAGGVAFLFQGFKQIRA